MKHILSVLSAAVLTAMATSSASAQYPGPGGMPQGYSGMPQGQGMMPGGMPQGYSGMPQAQGMMPGGMPQGQGMMQGMPPAMQAQMMQAAYAQQSQAAEAQAQTVIYQKRYGVHPFLSRLFCPSCSTCAGGSSGVGGTGFLRSLCQKRTPPAPPQQPPVAQGGTLVFPNHQFIRSPRDYFMVD